VTRARRQFPWRTAACAASLLLVALSTAVAAMVERPAVERVWQPLIAYAGQGDPALALPRLEQQLGLWAAVVRGAELDKPTQRVSDEFWEAWEDFDLEVFHELLPEQDGPARRLRLQGTHSGTSYRLGAPQNADFFVSPTGSRTRLGDLSSVVRVEPVATRDDDINYLIGGRLGLSMGALRWSGAQDGVAEALRLLASGDPRAPNHPQSEAARGSQQARARVVAAHRHLGPEDVEVLSTAWTGFPATSALVDEIGRVDDILSVDPDASAGYQHLTLKFQVHPGRLARRHAKLAEHVRGFDRLVKLSLDVTDPRGRLLRIHVDTETWVFSAELYVKDGEVLPYKNGRVETGQPWPAGRPHPLRLLVAARLMALGVKVQLDKLVLPVVQTDSEAGWSIAGALRDVPRINVEGNAMGFVPTGIIDIFIPGTLESLSRNFVATACRGNGGKGVTFAVDLRQHARDGSAIVNGELAFEAMDNALVQWGVSFFNDKVMLDEAAVRDSQALLERFVAAFESDLGRHAAELAQR
jgi:hypothetical protein